jgi:mono/diheme cytochrome c family protein
MLGEHDNINLEVNDKRTIFIRFYGVFYFILLAAIIAVGIKYLNSITMFSQMKLAGTLYSSGTMIPEQDLPVVKGTTSPPADVFKLSVPSQELLDKGKTLYGLNCSGCHGSEGKGDGIAGASLNPKPRNFHELTGWKNGSKTFQIYKTLQEGITATGMPSYSNLLPEERFSLIAFIRNFNPAFPKDSEEELKALDKTYSLSAGIKQPNQIPVKTASEKIISEDSLGRKIDLLKNFLDNNTTDTGAVIFKHVSNDYFKTLKLLAGDSEWLSSEKALIELAGKNIVTNGFQTSILLLGNEELSSLFKFLKDLFSKAKN